MVLCLEHFLVSFLTQIAFIFHFFCIQYRWWERYAYIHIHCVHCVYHKYMHTQYMHILRAYIHKLRKRITKYITYTTLSIYICIFGGFWRLVQPCRYLHGKVLLSNYPIQTICWIASFSIMMQWYHPLTRSSFGAFTALVYIQMYVYSHMHTYITSSHTLF